MSSDHEWDVLVVGGANTDFLVHGPRLPRPGETIKGTWFSQDAGGKGVNQAIAAARLGSRVCLVARVGAERRGEEVLAALATEGVDAHFVIRDEYEQTGVALIQVGKGGEKQMLTYPGANAHLSVADVRAAADAFERARVVLMQLEVPLEPVLQAVELGRRAGAIVILDPGPATPLPDKLYWQLDVIRPDAKEASTLTGIEVRDRGSAVRAAEFFITQGVKGTVIQAGDEGNLVVWPGGELWLPKIPVEGVDAVGAGDAFTAGLAVQFAAGRTLAEAGPFANAAAALATTVRGARASLPRRAAVEEMLATSPQATGDPWVRMRVERGEAA